MARPRNPVPSYLKHSSGQARVVLSDGQTVYLGKYGSPKSRTAYARFIAEHFPANKPAAPPLPRNQALTVAALVLRYVDHAEAYYGPNSEKLHTVKAAIRQLLALYGSLPADQFGPLKLETVRNALTAEGDQRKGKKGQPLARSYVNCLTKTVVRIFKWAASKELVPATVPVALATLEGLKKNRAVGVRETEKVKPVPLKAVKAVQKIVSPQIAAMIELQLLTGMRPDEVTIMRPCDIDQSGEVWSYNLTKHKTDYRGIEKTVYLGPKAQAVLRSWLDRDATSYLFSPREVREAAYAERKRNRKTPMTPSQAKRRPKPKPLRAPAERYTDASYRQAVQRACDKAKVESWSPGRLRHNAGTVIREKFGAEAAQLVLGHQNLRTTEVYAERDGAKHRRITRAIG